MTEFRGKSILARVSEGSSYRESTVLDVWLGVDLIPSGFIFVPYEFSCIRIIESIWSSVDKIFKYSYDVYSVPNNIRTRYLSCVLFIFVDNNGTFQYSGAPNENIVQNHLNIALLNVFYYLNGRYRHIFYPRKFFHLFGCPSLKSSDPKILGIKTYLVENFRQKNGRWKF